MDRCLGWKGVCVEANPKYFDKLSKLRSCNLVKTCISDSNAEVTFRLSGAGTSSHGALARDCLSVEGDHSDRPTFVNLAPPLQWAAWKQP